MTSIRGRAAVKLALVGITFLPAATPARAADKLWDNVNGGVFSAPSNWFGGVPGLNDVARFETTNSNFFQRTYTVDFTTDPINQQLVVEDDGVTFNLMAHTYELKNTFVAAALGTVPNRSGNLTVANGTLKVPTGSDLEIASVFNGSGVLTVGAGGTIGSFNDRPELKVGLNGNGTLEINSGGVVNAEQVTIGVNTGSTGTVTVTGNGSTLRIDDDLRSGPGAGTLRIQTGGTVVVGFATSPGNGDAIHLEGGSLLTRVFQASQGQFIWTSGRLVVARFEGNLTAPNGGVLGRFGNPQVEVTGQLTLLAGSTAEIVFSSVFGTTQIQANASAVIDGGNLRLVLDHSSFTPSPQDVFVVMTTVGGVFGSFANVASGQRVATSDGLGTFLVHYGPGSPFNPTSVVLSSYLPATPGDFDVDGDIDGNDFLIWQRGASPTPGSVADLAAWRVNFGNGASRTAGVVAAEPCSAAGFIPAFFALIIARRRSPLST